MLIRVNEQEAGKLQLDDQEVVCLRAVPFWFLHSEHNVHNSAVFIFLLAGHETIAHTLTISATLALLALRADIQGEISEQTVSVVGHDRDPVYDDYSTLDKVLSAFYEALRLFSRCLSYDP
ncbi:putative cytochrome P450 [Lyophyllum shimeji]|uniref:Cytochrome P450 n=1 Tax=Lyophyllum shimeji TaxID=47721 RepID=A0A9P3UTF3_LYOSH|nr:putative cytochrome P450 [Lyophyllum shimeji]